jgi:hypothetical protein
MFWHYFGLYCDISWL